MGQKLRKAKAAETQRGGSLNTKASAAGATGLKTVASISENVDDHVGLIGLV